MSENLSKYSEIYSELSNLLSNSEDVEKIYNQYRGLNISFPKRLYNKNYTTSYIEENYGKESIHTIARKLDLSERRIRQIAAELNRREE